MVRHHRNFDLFFFSLLIGLMLVSSLIAQQQPTPQSTPDPRIEAPKQPKSDQTPDKPDQAIGKSKLEQETGTVNDRIFAVLPNYGTAETNKTLQPLTTGQKFRLATASVFDWGSFSFDGALAGIAQARNDPKAWGQGWGAYGKRYGASFADNNVGTYLTTAVFPSLLHEDPRYFQMGKGKFSHRFSTDGSGFLLPRPTQVHAVQLLRIHRQRSCGGNFQHLPPRRRSHCWPKCHHLRLPHSLRWVGQ
jgi:hypothetical protein